MESFDVGARVVKVAGICLAALGLFALARSSFLAWEAVGKHPCDREFWQKPLDEREKIVAAFPLEKQFAYHQQRRHCKLPGDSLGFWKEMLVHRDQLPGFLKSVLEKDSDAETVDDVAEITRDMCVQKGIYDSSLVDLLQMRISALGNGPYKESASLNLQELEAANAQRRYGQTK